MGLAGEIRRLPNAERRVQEAARLGYTRAFVPAGSGISRIEGIAVTEVADINDALVATLKA